MGIFGRSGKYLDRIGFIFRAKDKTSNNEEKIKATMRDKKLSETADAGQQIREEFQHFIERYTQNAGHLEEQLFQTQSRASDKKKDFEDFIEKSRQNSTHLEEQLFHTAELKFIAAGSQQIGQDFKKNIEVYKKNIFDLEKRAHLH